MKNLYFAVKAVLALALSCSAGFPLKTLDPFGDIGFTYNMRDGEKAAGFRLNFLRFRKENAASGLGVSFTPLHYSTDRFGAALTPVNAESYWNIETFANGYDESSPRFGPFARGSYIDLNARNPLDGYEHSAGLQYISEGGAFYIEAGYKNMSGIEAGYISFGVNFLFTLVVLAMV